jgi:hypothetical protein
MAGRRRSHGRPYRNRRDCCTLASADCCSLIPTAVLTAPPTQSGVAPSCPSRRPGRTLMLILRRGRTMQALRATRPPPRRRRRHRGSRRTNRRRSLLHLPRRVRRRRWLPCLDRQLLRPQLPPPTSPRAASIPGGAVALARGAAEITDFGISVRHIDRLLGGLLLATSPRVDWAKQLLRTDATDVLACASCGGLLSPALRDHPRKSRRGGSSSTSGCRRSRPSGVLETLRRKTRDGPMRRSERRRGQRP